MNDYRPTIKTCAVCGKSFIVHCEDYVYKKYAGKGEDKKRIYFCRWNHMRDWEKANQKKGKRGKSKQADYG